MRAALGPSAGSESGGSAVAMIALFPADLSVRASHSACAYEPPGVDAHVHQRPAWLSTLASPSMCVHSCLQVVQAAVAQARAETRQVVDVANINAFDQVRRS
jgi:hypothetical protein